MHISYANEICATVQRASRMTRTSLSDVVLLLVVAKVSEILVTRTTREKLEQQFTEIKAENNILFIISLILQTTSVIIFNII